MENAPFEGQDRSLTPCLLLFVWRSFLLCTLKDLNCWPMFPWKGKGKGKKGKNKQGKGQSHTESKTDLAAKADDTESATQIFT